MIYAFVVAVVAAVWHAHTANKHARALIDASNAAHDRHANQLQRVIAQKNPDLEQLIALIDRQMQRIQAPVQAVVDHSMAQVNVPAPPSVGFDDDQGFWATKEELAEVEMAAELASR